MSQWKVVQVNLIVKLVKHLRSRILRSSKSYHPSYQFVLFKINSIFKKKVQFQITRLDFDTTIRLLSRKIYGSQKEINTETSTVPNCNSSEILRHRERDREKERKLSMRSFCSSYSIQFGELYINVSLTQPTQQVVLTSQLLQNY